LSYFLFFCQENSRKSSKGKTPRHYFQQQTMKFQILSNLHLELRKKIEIPVLAPILALLGDITCVSSDLYETFLLEQSDKFEHVIIVAGNEEYYGSTLQDTNEKIMNICSKRKNLHFLNNNTLELDENVVILGTTLWTMIPFKFASQVTSECSDFQKIQLQSEKGPKSLTLEDIRNIYMIDMQWLSDELSKWKDLERKVIVFTHHPPTSQNCLQPRYKSGHVKPWEKFLQFSNLEHLIGSPVELWAFGHTERSCLQLINGIKVVSNQMGMVQDDRFNMELVINSEESLPYETIDAEESTKVPSKFAQTTKDRFSELSNRVDKRFMENQNSLFDEISEMRSEKRKAKKQELQSLQLEKESEEKPEKKEEEEVAKEPKQNKKRVSFQEEIEKGDSESDGDEGPSLPKMLKLGDDIDMFALFPDQPKQDKS